jgi:hypothetical protein
LPRITLELSELADLAAPCPRQGEHPILLLLLSLFSFPRIPLFCPVARRNGLARPAQWRAHIPSAGMATACRPHAPSSSLPRHRPSSRGHASLQPPRRVSQTKTDPAGTQPSTHSRVPCRLRPASAQLTKPPCESQPCALPSSCAVELLPSMQPRSAARATEARPAWLAPWTSPMRVLGNCRGMQLDDGRKSCVSGYVEERSIYLVGPTYMRLHVSCTRDFFAGCMHVGAILIVH